LQQHQEGGIFNNADTPSSSRRTPSERLRDRASAALWVGAAVLVGRLSNFWTVVTLQQQNELQRGQQQDHGGGGVNSTSSSGGPSSATPVPVAWLMQVAGIAILVAILLGMYLVLYLPYVKGLTDKSAWPVYCPRIVPSMIAVSVVSYIALVRACWPVWGFLTPLVWTVEILGALFATHLIPWPFGS
jgi:hypothetical protein